MNRAPSAPPSSPQPDALIVLVNGEPMSLPAAATLATVVERLGLSGRKIAAAVNREVVPRASYTERQLGADDRVEILEAVGGG